MASSAETLRDLLAAPGPLVTPACYDALSVRMVERAGFKASFMSGFAVSAARLGLPDTGLISYAEMVRQGRDICNATSIPVLGDGDTGYGNALNVKRTVHGYAQAGFACVMIEDQVAPKRCGHTRGKQVVDRNEALGRMQAAVDARDEGADILIMARTDARATDGFDEALWRIQAFADRGADILFLESPQNETEMRAFCDGAPGYKMANMLEGGDTPQLPPERLGEMGFKIVAYPLTLLNAAMTAMEVALGALKQGHPPDTLSDFAHLRDVVGFNDYYEAEKKYAAGK
jgi:2-methylisocitrate lyase-like PEP mutase family enzyme